MNIEQENTTFEALHANKLLMKATEMFNNY